MTLQEIKDQVAKELGHSSHWYIFNDESGVAINEIAKRYATECVKASLERAAENVLVDFKLYPDLKTAERSSIAVDKSSITDPKNIILL